MNIIISILTKTLVKQFYQQHTGFFLLVAGICFGFMSSIEHKAIAQFFVSSPLLLCIPVVFWILYTMQIILFNRKIIQQPECEFLYTLFLIPQFTLTVTLSCVFIMELAPVILYSFFLMQTAFQLHQTWAIGYIIIAIFTALASTVSFFIHAIQHPNREKQPSRITTLLNLNFRRPYWQFFIEWILRKEFLALLGTKLFSCLLILAVCLLYINETYDERLLGMALSIAFTGNAFMLYQYHEFENKHLIILRNLPLSLSKRLFSFSIVFLIIITPELMVLYHNFPMQLGSSTLLQSLLFGLSILILLHGLLYIKCVNLETFIKHSFIISFASVVIILFTLPMWLITAINMTIGIILFAKRYYVFEANET